GAVRLDAGPGFLSYQLQDCITQQTSTSTAPGTYRLEPAHTCGGVHADSILITVEPATQVILPADTAVCPGSTLTYSLDGFDSYQWFPAAAVDCADCPAVNLTIDTSISIIVVAGTAIGCYSTDTVRIERIPAIYTTDTLLFCIGDTVTVFGQPASSPGDYEMAFTTANGCDSIHTITLAFFAPIEAGLTTTESCPGAENGQAMANPGGGLPPYQYFWSVPGENASTLDSLPPGSYQLTVTDANGCRAEVSFTIGEFDVFSVSLTPADASCFGEADGSLFIESEEAGLQFSLDGANYQPAPLFTGLEAGEYQLYILSANGCEGQASFRIGQPPEIILRLPQDTSVNLGDSLLLRAQAVPADSLLFSWSPEEGLSCADCLQPVASPLQTTVYQLIAEDNFGCSAEDGIEVRVNFEQKVYIPTAFSPNEDGRNDLFYLYGGAGVANILRLRVFGRWGELIYDEQNLAPNQPGRGWDGTFRGRKLNPGVFVYVAEVEFINGQVAVFKGEVNLVR
ncbi:MAG: gliding motility-associated C-terminal domain-containing protein, partial [Phaeodactylibacter sp.]|nr:gliding motility-associated C-terminal domain-containing protein [Phaeodactylibacter sp.]